MKNTLLTLAFAFTALIAVGQNTYTSLTPGTVPANPAQPTPPYNGSNPTGVPNQIPPTMDPDINKPLTPTLTPSTPQPGSTVPNTTSPVNPITPMNPNKEQG